MNKNKLNKKFMVIDLIFLASIFLAIYIGNRFLDFSKDYSRDNFYFAILLSLIFFTVYIVRHFNRPTFEEVKNQEKSGWRITGYYSKQSLRSEKIYYKSYDFWVKISIIFIVLEFLAFLIFSVRYNFMISRENMILHFASLLIVQIFSWVITRYREIKLR